MEDKELRKQVNHLAETLKDYNLETVKYGTLQAEILQMKETVGTMVTEMFRNVKKEMEPLQKEMLGLKEENASLLQIVKDLKDKHTADIAELKEKHSADITELKEKHSADIAELKDKFSTLEDEVVRLRNENKVLRNLVDTLRKAVSIEANQAEVVQYSAVSMDLKTGESDSGNETKDLAASTKQDSASAGTEVVADAEAVTDTEVLAKPDDSSTVSEMKVPSIRKAPKAQKKREQAEIFRNWKKTMNNRKIAPDLWASGLLKVTLELWEDDEKYMNEDQIFDFIERNAEQIASFISTNDSKKRFFHTLIKICSLRKVSKPKFGEIAMLFLNHGPRNDPINQIEIDEFHQMYS